MKKEDKMKLRKALGELDYEYCEKAPETERVGEYEVVFIPYTKVKDSCSKCFLNKQKDCFPCRSWERKDGKDGYWRFFRKKSEFDAVDRKIRSNMVRLKNKEKGGYDE